MGVIGCTLWMSSCKQAPEAQTSANYAIMKVTTADKELSTSYSATIRGRHDYTIHHSFGIGTCIGSRYLHSGRSDIGILLYGQ